MADIQDLFKEAWSQALVGLNAAEAEAEKVRARLQLKSLIYPEGMGERFQVLIQRKGAAGPKLTGLADTP